MRDKLFICSPELDKYPYPASCPFTTGRAGLVRKSLNSMFLLSGSGYGEMAAEVATDEEIERYHSKDYVNTIKRASYGEFDHTFLNYGLGTGDCPVFVGMYENFLWATGASLTAARQLLEGKARIAFNPAGGLHHAHMSHASGFCYINDVVLASLLFTEASKRVLFLDIDVHHTDGVQDAFYDRNDVMTISLHQSGRTLFPGTGFEDEVGEGEGKGFAVNVPLPPGTYDEAYEKVLERIAYPLIESYKPDVIILEAGADTLAGDPLAQLRLTNNIHAGVVEKLMSYDKPLLVTGGGGYNVENTVRAWSLIWTVLTGQDDDSHDLSAGLGGVMLQSTEWRGGLRDIPLTPETAFRGSIDEAIDTTIKEVKQNIFPIHGMSFE